MKIIVCYKLVPEVSGVKVKPDKTLDMSSCEWSISQYDTNAVEAAARLAASVEGSTFTALTAGGSITDNTKLRKAILARGPQDLKVVCDDALNSADCYATARVLADAIKKMGDVDVVVFGEGSGDLYAQQTGNMVGAMLGWNTVNAVSDIKMGDNVLEVSRTIEECTENLLVGLPAALSVTSDICTPRIASMRDILAAGKKPVEVWSLDDLSSAVENKTVIESILAPDQTDRMKIVKEADDEEHIDAVVTQLRAYI